MESILSQDTNCAISPAATMRQKVHRLEQALMKVPQVDCPVRHHFAPGIYAREINIPAGTALVGVVHKVDNLVIVSQGRLRLVTDEGAREVSAGEVLLCRAGTKNAAVALEDTRWTNIMANPDNEQSTAVLTERYTCATEDQLIGGANNAQLQANKAAAALQGENI